MQTQYLPAHYPMTQPLRHRGRWPNTTEKPNLLIHVFVDEALRQLSESLEVSLAEMLLSDGDQFFPIRHVLILLLAVVTPQGHDLVLYQRVVQLPDQRPEVVVGDDPSATRVVAGEERLDVLGVLSDLLSKTSPNALHIGILELVVK